jgi:mono/diheme cytochrome c family protein
VDYCAIFRSSPGSAFTPGVLNYGGTWTPTSDPATGWITAVDAGTGKVKWKYHAPAPVLSGITPTAGGIVLAGDNAGNFLVFNSESGAVIKQVSSGGSLSGGVITYQIKGRQYIAFDSGNISRTIFGAAGRPTIVVMALPESLATTNATRVPDEQHGRQLFNRTCAGCHGANGKNILYNGGDLTNVKKRMTFDQIVAWIKAPKPPMPKVFPEPLQPAEEADLRDIAKYVHEWPECCEAPN